MHRFYTAKAYLKRFKSEVDTSSSFCVAPKGTALHTFWDSPHTHTLLFWMEFSKFINFNVLLCFSLFFKDVLFGFININLLMLLAKFYIHCSKFTHQCPLFIVFRKEVQQYIQTISSSRNTKALFMAVKLFNL